MKSLPEILEEVRALIASTCQIHPDTIQPDCPISDITADSIQLFELLMAFEQQYELQTSYADIVNINTVSDIAAYLATHKYHLS